MRCKTTDRIIRITPVERKYITQLMPWDGEDVETPPAYADFFIAQGKILPPDRRLTDEEATFRWGHTDRPSIVAMRKLLKEERLAQEAIDAALLDASTVGATTPAGDERNDPTTTALAIVDALIAGRQSELERKVDQLVAGVAEMRGTLLMVLDELVAAALLKERPRETVGSNGASLKLAGTD